MLLALLEYTSCLQIGTSDVHKHIDVKVDDMMFKITFTFIATVFKFLSFVSDYYIIRRRTAAAKN